MRKKRQLHLAYIEWSKTKYTQTFFHTLTHTWSVMLVQNIVPVLLVND